MKLLTYLEELGFLMTHSGAEFGWGIFSDLCACSTPLAAMRLSSSEHTVQTVVRKKMDQARGAEPVSVQECNMTPTDPDQS